MSEKIFTVENLDDYRNHPDILDALDGITLLNHDEFMTWYSPPQIKLGERGNRIAETLPSRLPEIETIHTISKEIMITLANSVCEGNIGREYGEKAIARLTEHGFDLLVALAPDHEELNNPARISTRPKAQSKRKIKHILGLIIVEKGECKQYPDEFCVNLICSRAKPQYSKFYNNPYQRVKGALIMGAYLFCLKKMGKRMGILELADGYQNIGGFISYTKMGFALDHSLYGQHCFKECENLPMSISLAGTTYNEIIGRASGKSPLSKPELKRLDPTGLSGLVPKNPFQIKLQKDVATLCNLIYKTPHIISGQCKLHPRIDKPEVELLYSIKTLIKKGKETEIQEEVKRELREGAIHGSERDITKRRIYSANVEPTLEEILEKFENYKQASIDEFDKSANQVAVIEPVVEAPRPVTPTSPPVFSQENKTKRKRSPSAKSSVGSRTKRARSSSIRSSSVNNSSKRNSINIP